MSSLDADRTGSDMFGELKGALQASLSTSGEARKQSEQVLGALETRPGYLSCLLEIAQGGESEGGARELAGIILKIGCSKLWRKLSQEEKAHLRCQLLEKVDVLASDGVGVQLSLCVARIARNDFPGQWQELFPTLIHKLGGGQSAAQNGGDRRGYDKRTKRNLYVLYCVIKELASKRLPADRRTFQELSQQLIPVVWALFCRSSEQVATTLSAGGIQNADALVLGEVWHLCAKCMKRLLVSGFPPDAKTYQVHSQFKEMLPQMLQILKIVHQQYAAVVNGAGATQDATEQRAAALILRGLCKILKIFRDVIDVHPWSFIVEDISVPALEYLHFNVSATKGGGGSDGSQQRPGSSIFVEDICTLCISVLQAILRSSAYRSGLPRGETDQAKLRLVQGAQQLLGGFFSAERLEQMIVTIVSVHMVLKAEDIEKWQAAPEEFHHENDLGNFSETLRSECEKLLCKFLETFKDQTICTLMKMINQVQAMPRSQASLAFDQLLLKESLYNAMCLAAYDLHDSVNFKSFFETHLIQDFDLQREETRIIVRRAAYLLAAWIADVPEDARSQVYHVLTHQLLPCEDVVIKLAACSVLRIFIDDYSFFEDQFQPFLHQALRHLLLLIQNAFDFDSQVQAFQTLCLILERMGPRVKPFANDIVSMIPEVWQNAGDQSLLRIQVLSAMHRMMQCLGASSASTYPIIVPLLQYSVNPDGPESVSIYEDALLLLHSVLQFAVELTPQVAELVIFVARHMQRSTEYLPLTSKILEAYLLVGGLPFLQVHHNCVFGALLDVVNSINSRGLAMMAPALDLILQIFPQGELGVLEPIFQSLLRRLVDDNESDEALIHIACVFARLAITNLAYFVQVIGKCGTQMFGSEDALFGRLVFVWTEKSYAVASVLKRKILCVGLVLLLDTNHPSISSRIPEPILPFLLEVGHEFKSSHALDEIDLAQEWHDAEDYLDDSGISPGEEDPDAARRAGLWKSDPVNKAQLVPMLQDRVAKGVLTITDNQLAEDFKHLCSS